MVYAPTPDVSGAVAAHEAAANPHPVYLTQAEADALYLTAAAGDALFLTPAEGNAAYQPLDTQLTSVAGLTYTSNGGKVVRVNGAENAFELVSSASVGNVSITEIVASTNLPAANLVNITGIPDTYRELVLIVTGCSSDTATRTPLVLVSTDNGSTYATTGYITYTENSAGATAGVTSALHTSGANQTAAQTITFVMRISAYQSGGGCHAVTIGSQSGVATYNCIGTYMGSTDNIDALQIIWNGSGNFDAGTYKLLGIT
jgi:hypothetical protein